MKEIKPGHELSFTRKRNTESVSKRDLVVHTALIDHCGLPVHDKKFPTFVFKYSKTANLDKIIELLKGYNRNSARILTAIPLEQIHMIIIQMNRRAYLQVAK